jgi:hypothetical protein
MKKYFYVSIVLVLFSIFIVVATGSAVCVNPPSNLVSWWPGDGNASDIIGPNDGTLYNGTTFAPGKVGQAFSFDGFDDEMVAPGTNFDDLQQLTIDAWVKHNSLPTGEIMIYVMMNGKAVLRYDGGNGPQQLHFFLITDGGLEHIRVNNALQVGVFHHVAGTYDGSVMRLYLDGAEVGSHVVSGTVEDGAGVSFSSTVEPFDGLLDEVEIYNCDLSASQIQAIYVADLGDTIHVPNDYPTIQSAIDEASAGDTVLVADGIYTGSGNKNLNFGGKAITVRSENGPNNCIIDSEGSGRGFEIWRGEGNDSVVSGFTITNSETGQNAFDISNSSPTIENCVITGNGGSGIVCDNANPIITNCTIANNTADYGGGIWLWNNSYPTIINCTIKENNTALGATIHCGNSSPTITNCTIADNTGGDSGGIGLYNSPLNTIITNSIIKNNTGSSIGGINCYDSSLIITNCTIADNTGGDNGGIDFVWGLSLTITNSILWGDYPNEINTGPTSPAHIVTFSNIQGGYSGAGNIAADPLFVGNGDYHLTALSPCINKGTSIGAPDYDIDGDSRPQGAGYDIGADEYAGPEPEEPFPWIIFYPAFIKKK